jgi:hypothetical protein
MHKKLTLISAFLLLCGPFSAQGFDVFQDPDNFGNPGPTAGIPTNGDPVHLNIWVRHSTTFYGWDLRIEATGDVTMSFGPNDSNVVSQLTGSKLLRANRVDPVTGSTEPQRVGTLSVQVSSGGSGNVEVSGEFVFGNAPPSRGTIGTITLASTDVCNPNADSDGDGDKDCDDVCPYVPNSDICLCGDVTGNGLVNSSDAGRIMRWKALVPGVVLTVPGNCDVNNSANNACTSSDARAIMQMLVGEGSIQQSCQNAEP